MPRSYDKLAKQSGECSNVTNAAVGWLTPTQSRGIACHPGGSAAGRQPGTGSGEGNFHSLSGPPAQHWQPSAPGWYCRAPASRQQAQLSCPSSPLQHCKTHTSCQLPGRSLSQTGNKARSNLLLLAVETCEKPCKRSVSLGLVCQSVPSS